MDELARFLGEIIEKYGNKIEEILEIEEDAD